MSKEREVILQLEVSLGDYPEEDIPAGRNADDWAETLYQSDLTIQDCVIKGVHLK